MDAVPDAVDAVLYLLAALSVLTWSIVFAKFSRFWQNERRNRRFLANFAPVTHLREVDPVLEAGAGPLVGLGRAGMNEWRALAGVGVEMNPRDRRDLLRQALRQQMHEELGRQESGLAVLASVGATAPFIGLFGTVWASWGP